MQFPYLRHLNNPYDRRFRKGRQEVVVIQILDR